ncbi:MAG: hypothetical protein Q8Q06_02105 [bacterium]|nr:hypothetical protein [bacterium]
MTFLRIIQLLVFVTFIYSMVTQVVVPLWNGTKLFPTLRTKEGRLKSELTDLRQKEAEALLARRVSEEKERLSKLQNDNTVNQG